jgi:hypothetical protein
MEDSPMRHRRLGLAVLASAVSLLAACASPETSADTKDKVADAAPTPRDCEPQTGTRVPASCTKRGGVGSSSGSVQTMGKPAHIGTN